MPDSTDKRAVFFVSDHTGITAENIGMALLTHFPNQQFHYVRRPFVKTLAEAQKVVAEINASAKSGLQPLVFTTVVVEELLAALKDSAASVYDILGPEIKQLERELGDKAQMTVTQGFHSIGEDYFQRMEALEFSLQTDDGGGERRYDQADIILVGVSRVGKTPTSFYLSLIHGKRVSNYPLTEDDIERGPVLPPALAKYRHKLFGLTINPQRLHEVRTARKPDSKYCTLQTCQFEVQWAERLFREYGIPMRETTTSSVEEIAAGILKALELSGMQA